MTQTKKRTQEIIKTDADVIIMCDVAFGDTEKELIEMSKTIKAICLAGKVVQVIPFTCNTQCK